MKVLVISDVHSNVRALEAVEAAEGSFDLVLCVGDLMDWGMFPHETIQWFKNHDTITVSGNHDRELIALWDGGVREPIGQETTYLSRCINHITAEDVDFLRALPLDTVVNIDGYTYYLKHAYDESLIPEALLRAMCDWQSQPLFEKIWEEKVGGEYPLGVRRIILGHSHQCWMHMVRGGSLFLNPGSIHYRLSYDTIEPGADYIVITDGVPMMKHVDYPTAEVREMLKDCHFLPHLQEMATSFSRSRIDE